MNYQAIDVHVALPAGLYRYEPAGHVLCFEVPRDLRAMTGNQDFTAEAALDLVFVADDSRVQVQGDSARTTPTRRRCDGAERVSVLCLAGLGDRAPRLDRQ